MCSLATAQVPSWQCLATTAATTDQPLGDLSVGSMAVIVRVYPETDCLLTYLVELDLLPGRQVTLREIAPFQGPLVLLTAAGVRHVGREAAAHIYVRPLSEEPA